MVNGQDRLRPPNDVGCDRNELTVYAGVIRTVSETKSHVKLTIRTDEATTETVTVPLSRTGGHKAKAGERVRAWVCEKGPVTLEWEKQ